MGEAVVEVADEGGNVWMETDVRSSPENRRIFAFVQHMVINMDKETHRLKVPGCRGARWEREEGKSSNKKKEH